MSRSRMLAVLLVGGVAGCGANEPPAVPIAARPGQDVASIAVDPSDGTLLAGGGRAVYRLRPGAGAAERATGRITTPKGVGTVTRDVVLRFTADGTLVASGHSADDGLPAVLGLVRSTDQGETWQPVSGLGEADYHELEVAGERIVALRYEDPGLIQLSGDGGLTWERREAPAGAAAVDVALDPGDPDGWAVSTDEGVFVSTDGGSSWRPRDTTPGARLVWAAPDALVLARQDGTVRRSADAGRTWRDVGALGSAPRELTVGIRGDLYASVAGGEIRRSTDGGATWSTVTRLG